MSKNINTGFNVLAPEPIDSRMQVALIIDLPGIPVKYNKMKTYVLEDDREYIYTASSDSWEIIADSSTSATWGSISGVLSAQSDLVAEFAKYALTGHTHPPTAPSAHTHPPSEITDILGQVTWGRENVGPNFILSGSSGSSTDPDSTIFMLQSEFATINPTEGYVDKAMNSLQLDGRPASDFLSASTSIFTHIQFNILAPNLTYNEGKIAWDPESHTLNLYPEFDGPVLQIGQEQWLKVFNNSGVEIWDGAACSVSAVQIDGTPEVSIGNSLDPISAKGYLGIATMAIADQTYGYINISGMVRDIDTSPYAEGSVLYLSATNPGYFETVRPSSPAYEVRCGGVAKQDAINGRIYSEPRVIDNTHDLNKFFDGCILESHTVTTAPNGTTVPLTLSATTPGPLSMIFDQDFYSFPDLQSIDLILGTDVAPQRNYVYIPKSTKVLTVSTVEFPTSEQYIAIADVMVPSAATALSDGLYKLHAYTDHVSSSVGRGHLSELNEWIRHRPAQWDAGNTVSFSVAEGVSSASIDIAYSTGTVRQLHLHTVPGWNTAGTDNIFVVNDFTSPYKSITNLNSVDLSADSEGTSLGNGYWVAVIWASASQELKDSQLYLNLPNTSYSNITDALNDVNGSTNFSIPKEYLGSGYLLTKIVFKKTSTNIQIVAGGVSDLRGLFPATGAGGGTVGGGGVSSFLELSDTPVDYIGHAGKITAVNSAGNALEFVSLFPDITWAALVALGSGGRLPHTGYTLTDSIYAGRISLDSADYFTWVDASGFYNKIQII